MPADGTVYVICAKGGRSLRAAEFYRAQGIDAVNVAGGTTAWIDAGQPVVDGDGAVTPAPARPGYRWVDAQREFDAFLDAAADADAFALDTEFHRERTYYARLALLQLAGRRRDRARRPAGGRRRRRCAALLDSDAECIMHAASQDLEILERACGVGAPPPGRHADGRRVRGLGSPGLGVLAAAAAGREPAQGRPPDRLAAPPARRGRPAPTRPPTSPTCSPCGRPLRDRARATAAGWTWALDECDRRRDRARRAGRPRRGLVAHQGGPPAARAGPAAWPRRSPPGGSERAREVDQPVRHVLPDLAVVAIAERPPRTAGDLGTGAGPRRPPPARAAAGDELLAAVEAGAGHGRGRAAAAAPRRGRLDLPAGGHAGVGLGQPAVARRRPRHRRSSPPGPTSRRCCGATGRRGCSPGWRADVAGAPSGDLLEGEAALAFDGDGQLVLEARSHAAPGAVDPLTGTPAWPSRAAGRGRSARAVGAARPGSGPRRAGTGSPSPGAVARHLDGAAPASTVAPASAPMLTRDRRRSPGPRAPAGRRPCRRQAITSPGASTARTAAAAAAPATPAGRPAAAGTGGGSSAVVGRQRLDVAGAGVGRPRQPGSVTPQPWSGAPVHGIGARQPSRPPGSTTRSGGIDGVLEPQLLARVEERRAPQPEQQEQPRRGRGPRCRSGCGGGRCRGWTAPTWARRRGSSTRRWVSAIWSPPHDRRRHGV